MKELLRTEPQCKHFEKIIILVLAVLLFTSCSHIPFAKENEATGKDRSGVTEKNGNKSAGNEEKQEPKPGDIKAIDGVDYIYARNRKYMLTPYEPEYVWIRKDQYSPGMGENLLSRGGMSAEDKKTREDMEKRIVKLEEELKRKGIAPQMAYPVQLGYSPVSAGVAIDGPKRRVVVLPIEDRTNFKSENLGDQATKQLISKLESTGAIICTDPSTISMKDLANPAHMKILNELYGIRAVLKASLSDVYTTASRMGASEEASFATSKIDIDVYDTDTGIVLKKLTGRNPILLSKEKGDLGTEKAKVKAIGLSIEMITDDLLRAVLALDWHARVVSVEGEKVFINAGRLSGLEAGKVLQVYAKGEEVIDAGTKAPLGSVKGPFKGEIEIVELFGVDACWGKMKKGESLLSSDLVYVK